MLLAALHSSSLHLFVQAYSTDPGSVLPSMLNAVDRVYVGLPLQLASAITVHKSVGTTLPAVIVDCAENFFSWHQLYEALSRCPKFEFLQALHTHHARSHAHSLVAH